MFLLSAFFDCHYMFLLPTFLYQHGGVILKLKQHLLQTRGTNFVSANNYVMKNYMIIY